jgi:hypothetical protein
MSDKITNDKVSNNQTWTGDLFHKVMEHESKVWSDVSHGRGTVGEYLEVGAETIAALALAKVGVRSLAEANRIATIALKDATEQLPKMEARASETLGVGNRGSSIFRPTQS